MALNKTTSHAKEMSGARRQFEEEDLWRRQNENAMEMSAESCDKCEGTYSTWFAPNPLWNAVEQDCGYSFLCPSCFSWCAEQVGVKTGAWVFTDEVAGYDAAARLAYAVREIATVAEQAHEVYRLASPSEPAPAICSRCGRPDDPRRTTCLDCGGQMQPPSEPGGMK